MSPVSTGNGKVGMEGAWVCRACGCHWHPDANAAACPDCGEANGIEYHYPPYEDDVDRLRFADGADEPAVFDELDVRDWPDARG